MEIEDRELFLKYALPCASTLVKRGSVTQDHIDNLIVMVSNGQMPKENAEEMFKVATAVCGHIAERMNKQKIDTEVVRQYFLFEHSPVVDQRYDLMHDFNPVDCKTYTGVVSKTENGYAIVRTSLGERKYKTVFARDVKENDKVVVHFDFIIEKISDETAEKMENARLEYEKRN